MRWLIEFMCLGLVGWNVILTFIYLFGRAGDPQDIMICLVVFTVGWLIAKESKSLYIECAVKECRFCGREGNCLAARDGFIVKVDTKRQCLKFERRAER